MAEVPFEQDSLLGQDCAAAGMFVDQCRIDEEVAAEVICILEEGHTE